MKIQVKPFNPESFYAICVPDKKSTMKWIILNAKMKKHCWFNYKRYLPRYLSKNAFKGSLSLKGDGCETQIAKGFLFKRTPFQKEPFHHSWNWKMCSFSKGASKGSLLEKRNVGGTGPRLRFDRAARGPWHCWRGAHANFRAHSMQPQGKIPCSVFWYDFWVKWKSHERWFWKLKCWVIKCQFQ